MDDPVDGAGDPLNTSQCLLPPSYFTVPAAATSREASWSRSALQCEIDRLREELGEMRARRGASPFPETAALYNEALAQQASELARCRSEWERERAELMHEASEWRVSAWRRELEGEDFDFSLFIQLQGGI